MVEGRQLLRQKDRVPQVVVEHQRADPDPFCTQRSARQRQEWGRLVPDVVADLEDVEAGVLGGASVSDDVSRRPGRGLQAESEWPTRPTIPSTYRDPSPPPPPPPSPPPLPPLPRRLLI